MTTQTPQILLNTKEENTKHSPFLSDSQIAKRYDVTRQTVWRWAANDPKFPNSIKFSAGCTRWRLSDIEAWESGKGEAK